MSDIPAVEALLSIALGIGLAAAVGLRIFLPLLIASVAAMYGWIELSPAFAWLATWPALIALAVATLLEILAYYVPGVDHALDALAAPAAVIAGAVVSAAVMTDLPPLVKWTTAVIAGGGVAGLVHGVTSLLRAKSSLATGGVGNPLVATGELGGSLLLALLALVAPALALLGAIALVWLGVAIARRAVRAARTSRPT
jgi:hypothetical protein